MRKVIMLGLVAGLLACQQAPTAGEEATLQAKAGVLLPVDGGAYVQFLDAQDLLAMGVIHKPAEVDAADLPWKPGTVGMEVTISCEDIFQTLDALGIVSIPSDVSAYFDCRVDADGSLPPSYFTIGAVGGYGTSFQGFAGAAVGIAAGVIAWGGNGGGVDAEVSIVVNGTFERQFGGSFSLGSVAAVAYGAAAFVRVPPDPVGIQIIGSFLFDAGSGIFYDLALNFQGKRAADGSLELKPVDLPLSNPVASLN